MVSDSVYELCSPILNDASLDEEEKTDKLQELLSKETSLGGPGLENTVLDILWKYREQVDSQVDRIAKATPKTRYQTIRRSSPAPWGSGRPSTPIAGSPRPGTSPAHPPGFSMVPPSLVRGRSQNNVTAIASPFGSPRMPSALPRIPLSPSLDRYELSADSVGLPRQEPGFGSGYDDWMTTGMDGADDDGLFDGPTTPSTSSHAGALPYDMLRSVAGEQLTDEELEAALEASGYDLGAALNALSGRSDLAINDMHISPELSRIPHVLIGKSMRTKAPVSPRPSTPSGRSRQGIICKYFLSTGSCLRDDCRFSHDPSKHVCKYWMSGSCLAGESCVFSHDPALAIEQMNLGQPALTPGSKLNPNVSDFSYFPSLPTPATGEPAVNSLLIPRHAAEASNFVPVHASDSGSPRSLPRSRLSGNASAFQPRSRPESRQASGQLNEGDVEEFPSLAAAAAARRIRNSRRSSQNALNRPRNLADIVRHSTADDNNEVSPSSESHHIRSSENTRQIAAPTHIPWLETGSEANRAYLNARAAAMKHASLRNRFLQSAAQAWNRNDARAAKALSMRGQAENETMRRLHREAAAELYASRNAHKRSDNMTTNPSLYRKDQNPDSADEVFIDLHGLHTDEAVEYMEKCLVENQQSEKPVYVITGTGHHSRNARDKLGRSVKEWLEGWGYAYKEFSVPGDRNAAGGILGVDPGSFDRSLLTEGGAIKGNDSEPSGYLGEGKIRLIKERPNASKR